MFELFCIWRIKLQFLTRSNLTTYFLSIRKASTSKRKNMAPSIPDRWIPYKACGKVIEGTRFICFKVPLKRRVQTGNRDITEIWDIKALLSTIPNLGAVIDLTNTARYYDPKELQAAGVLHKKILMPGRIIPPVQTVNEFMDACDEFLGKDCDFLVGVHCTHGLNRTGYMVCRYMRDRLGIDAKEAIKRFQIARGYQIERENYLADLIGSTPLPPHLGSSTKLKPVNNEDESDTLTDQETNKYNKYERNKYTYNGQSWRDEYRGNNVESWRNDCWGRDNDDSTSGRYVRHPSYSRNSYRDRLSDGRTNGDERRSSRIQNREDRTSSDSNRSYDFRYDY